MQNDCIFCRIIRGEIPCIPLLETDDVIAFMDIHPVNPGHALVVPKAHHPTLFDMPSECGAAVFDALRRVGRAVMQGMGAQGLNVLQNNSAAAGQEVPHVHWHLVPRFEGDGHTLWKPGPCADMQQLQASAKAVRALL